MAQACDAQSLAQASVCIDRFIPDGMKLSVINYLLCQILNAQNGAVPNLYGNGSPVGSVSATLIGQMYFDISNPAAVNTWVATATGSGGWYEVAGS